MNPQLYGMEHIIYIIISIISALCICILAKIFAKTKKSQKIIIKISALILFLIIFINRIVLVFEYEKANWLKMITDTFCSTSSYVLSLAILFGKENNCVLHFIWLIALAGGIITTFYPDFIGQNPSFLYPPTIFGLMHHTFSAIVVILLFEFNYLNLTYKKWYCTLWGFCAYFSYGAFLMCVLNFSNPFYMTGPALPNTPLTAWVIAPIYITIYAVILLIVELIRNNSRKKNSTIK